MNRRNFLLRLIGAAVLPLLPARVLQRAAGGYGGALVQYNDTWVLSQRCPGRRPPDPEFVRWWGEQFDEVMYKHLTA